MRGCIRAGARNWVISRVVGQGGGRQFLATMEPHSRENCKTVEAEMMSLNLKFLITLNICAMIMMRRGMALERWAECMRLILKGSNAKRGLQDVDWG